MKVSLDLNFVCTSNRVEIEILGLLKVRGVREIPSPLYCIGHIQKPKFSQTHIFSLEIGNLENQYFFLIFSFFSFSFVTA